MSNNIDLIAFGTFGLPNGFRQTSFLKKQEYIHKIKTFDLNTNAIKIFPKTKVYSIRKEIVNGANTIAYSIYSFAKEKNSDRGGTFVGISIMFFGKIALESLILNCIDNFHDQLINNKNNIENNIIQVNHSDQFQLSSNIRDLDKINFNLKDFNDINFSPSNNDLIVYTLIKPELFEKSLELLNIYDTIYFTKSDEIGKFVHEKQLIRLAKSQEEFNNEIEGYQIRKEEEKKRRLDQAISKVQSDLRHLDEQKDQYIKKNSQLIDDNHRIIKENEMQIKKFSIQYNEDIHRIDRSRNYLNKINEHFNQVRIEFTSAIEYLKSEKKQPNEVFYILEKHIRELDENKSKLDIPSISRLNNFSEISNAQNSFLNRQENSHRYKKSETSELSKKLSKRIKTHQIINILLFLLLASVFFYFLVFEKGLLNGLFTFE